MNPAFAEDVDSGVLAGAAAGMAEAGQANSLENAEDYDDQAESFDASRIKYQKLADQYFAAGNAAAGKEALAKAKQYENSRNAALQKANQELDQSDAYDATEGSEVAAELARTMPEPEEATDFAATDHVAKVITGPQGGKVAIDNPTSEGVHFVCDGGECRAIDGNKAMENSFKKWMAVDPGDTHAVRNVDEIIQSLKNVPEGEPVTISGHGNDDGLTLDSETQNVLIKDSPEYNRLAQALKGHPVTFESCSLASIPGYCSGLAAQSGDSVTGYDKTVYLGTDHMYAKDPNTSEHTWQPTGSELGTGEIVQNPVESQISTPNPNRIPATVAYQSSNSQYVSQGFSQPPLEGSVSAEVSAQMNPMIAAGIASAINAATSNFQAATILSSGISNFSSAPLPQIQNVEVEPLNESNGDNGGSPYAGLLAAVRNPTFEPTQSTNQQIQQITNSVLGLVRSQAPQAPSSSSQILDSQGNLTQSAKLTVRKVTDTLAQTIGQADDESPLGTLLK